MADERIDHAAEAESLTSQAFAAMRMGEEPPEALATLALKEATLALVEQQRIANLIALAHVANTDPDTSVSPSELQAWTTLGIPGAGTLRPDIAAALGVSRD